MGFPYHFVSVLVSIQCPSRYSVKDFSSNANESIRKIIAVTKARRLNSQQIAASMIHV